MYYILSILSKAPISSRNKIEAAGIDAIIRSLFEGQQPPDPGANEYAIYQLSKSIMEKWDLLPRVFKIPKRAPNQTEELSTPFSAMVSNADHTQNYFEASGRRSDIFLKTAFSSTKKGQNGWTAAIQEKNSWNTSYEHGHSWGNEEHAHNDEFCWNSMQSDPSQSKDYDIGSSSYENGGINDSGMPSQHTNIVNSSFNEEICSPSNSASSDLFSHLMDNTLNSLKRSSTSKIPDNALFSQPNEKRPRRPCTFRPSMEQMPNERLPLSSELSLKTLSEDTNSRLMSPQSSMLISPIQVQHIIRKATLSASINNANQTSYVGPTDEMVDDGYVGGGGPLYKSQDLSAAGAYRRDAWGKLLKAQAYFFKH